VRGRADSSSSRASQLSALDSYAAAMAAGGSSPASPSRRPASKPVASAAYYASPGSSPIASGVLARARSRSTTAAPAPGAVGSGAAAGRPLEDGRLGGPGTASYLLSGLPGGGHAYSPATAATSPHRAPQELLGEYTQGDALRSAKSRSPQVLLGASGSLGGSGGGPFLLAGGLAAAGSPSSPYRMDAAALGGLKYASSGITAPVAAGAAAVAAGSRSPGFGGGLYAPGSPGMPAGSSPARFGRR